MAAGAPYDAGKGPAPYGILPVFRGAGTVQTSFPGSRRSAHLVDGSRCPRSTPNLSMFIASCLFFSVTCFSYRLPSPRRSEVL